MSTSDHTVNNPLQAYTYAHETHTYT